MLKEELNNLYNKQKEFFEKRNTLDVSKRIKYLKKLKASINMHIEEIYQALYLDLGKSKEQSYMCEIGLVLNELSYFIKKTKSLAKKKRVHTPLAQFHSSSYRFPIPYGNILVMAPWNYPFLLSIDPIVEAVAAGNTVTLKTSEYSPRTNEVMKKIIDEVFEEEYVKVIFGGFEANTLLLDLPWDYIFFTGSKHVGKLVYSKASEKMIPCTLELGGKSPCIIDKTANLKIAAKRIAFGKFLNLGQTCVAPDYILCDKSIKEEFIKLLIKEIKNQYGENALLNKNYGKMINKTHFERVRKLIDPNKVVIGGKVDETTLQIEPTILDLVSLDDLVMKEEIFGPVLPIITVESFENAVKIIEQEECPLACYLFSKDKKQIEVYNKVLNFGGGCINDTIIHLAISGLPFGGFKNSGIGSYHGKNGFETFSHYKSIVDKKMWIDLPMRYQPYTKLKDFLVKMFLK